MFEQCEHKQANSLGLKFKNLSAERPTFVSHCQLFGGGGGGDANSANNIAKKRQGNGNPKQLDLVRRHE